MTADKLIVATRNVKKGHEMVALISPAWEPLSAISRFQIQTLAAYPDLTETIEDATTFAGNAAKKATEAAIALNAWVVADDSGLAVDALDGAPGVFSARYAGTHGDDEANNRKLLEALKDMPDELRGAAFVCSLAVSDPAGTIVATAEGKCRGRIIHEPRGANGFGYDPLFLIREYHKTFAELGSMVKHQLSHRSRAFARLRPMLSAALNKA